MEGILQPLMLLLSGPFNNKSGIGQKLGLPPPMHGVRLSLTPVSWTLTGISRDSTGAPLAGCTCTLFRVTENGAMTLFEQEQQVVSGADGSYVFTGSSPEPYKYRVTFDLAGAPVRAGLTLKSLVGV